MMPAGLTPVEPEAFVLPSGVTIHVPKAVATFKVWTKDVPFDRYGNKAVLDYRGEPMFAELVILRMFEEADWNGVWADSYRRKYWKRMDEPADLPASVRKKLESIVEVSGCRGGCFDVVLWRGAEMLFVESKRAGKDHIRETQLRWVAAALASGVSLDRFLIVEWDAVDAHATSSRRSL